MVIVYNILLFIFVSSALACVGPNQSSVISAIASAERNATVEVCSGSATWSSESLCGSYNSLACITKGIKLQGGIGGETIITLAGSTDRGQIRIIPDAAFIADNEVLEISNFTLKGDSSYKNEGLLYLYNSSNSTNISNVKIHNIRFEDSAHTGININGLVYGVAYNNTFVDIGYPIRTFGRDAVGWTNTPLEYGINANFVFEDNNISCTIARECGLIDYGQGAPGIVHRYNTINLDNAGGMTSLWTIHGLQSMAISDGYACPSGCGYGTCSPSIAGSCDATQDVCSQWSAIKSEFYGNKIINSPAMGTWIAQRGSWLLMHNNIVDNNSPNIYYSQYSCDTCQYPASPAFSQHVQNTYIWSNYGGGNLKSMGKNLDFCADAAGGAYTITENVDYWNHKTSFDGTIGMGVGALVNRPNTCTTGVGYWATDQDFVNNSSDMTGANPTIPIYGTLYKCTSTDTWEPYYTPYTYPHPLRAQYKNHGSPKSHAQRPPT